MTRKMILPIGNDGDVTCGWDEADDDKVMPIIQQMIDQKWRFFVLEYDGTQAPLVSVDQVATTRSIVIPQPLLEQLHQSGILKVGAKVAEAQATGEIARTPEAVAAADTIVTPPAQGG